MATISGKNIYLYDRWPGVVTSTSKPPGGFDSTKEGSGNCVYTPAFNPGEKRAWYNDSTKNAGYSIFCYMQFVEGSDSAYDADADISTGYGLCAHIQDMSEHTGDGDTNWFMVSHDCTNTDATMGGAVAVAMCDFSGGAEVTVTTSKTPQYGWFWVGGVCPCNTKTDSGGTDMTKTAGEIKTDGNVAIGNSMHITGDGTNALGLTHSLIDSTKHLYDIVVGKALATDA